MIEAGFPHPRTGRRARFGLTDEERIERSRREQERILADGRQAQIDAPIVEAEHRAAVEREIERLSGA